MIDRTLDAPEYALYDDGGEKIDGHLTNDNTPIWSNAKDSNGAAITAKPGAIIEIYADHLLIGQTVVDKDGLWSIPAGQPLSDGEYLVSVTIKGAAQNVPVTTTQTLHIDTVPPIISLNSLSGDGVLNSVEKLQGLSVSGTTVGAEDGQMVTLVIKGVLTTQTFTDIEVNDGQWLVHLTPADLDSLGLDAAIGLEISATVTDAAGNVSLPAVNDVVYKEVDLDKPVDDNEPGRTVSVDESSLNAGVLVEHTGQFEKPDSVHTHIYLEAPTTALSSGGQPIEWVNDANLQKLIGYADGEEVIVISIDHDGQYSVILKKPLDHGAADTNDVLSFDVRMNFANERGNIVASKYITLSVNDDAPESVSNISHDLGTNTYQVSGGVLVDFGADGGFVQKVKVGDATFELDLNSNAIVTSGNLDHIVTYAYNNKGLEDGQLMISTVSGETLLVNLVTGQYDYDVEVFTVGSYQAEIPASVNIGGDSSLLGLVDLNVAGLIALENEQLFSVQGNGIYQVDVTMSGLDLGNILGGIFTGNFKQFTYNDDLRRELGLSVTATSDVALKLTITSATEGELDAFKVNQFLDTVTVNGGLKGLLGLSILPGALIEAKGESGNLLADKYQVKVAEVSLLENLLKGENVSTKQIDQVGLDSTLVVKNSKVSNSLYGLDGDDTLVGGIASDILYGGTGNDTLSGNLGNDILVGGQGNDLLIGGAGADIFRWEENDHLGNIGVAKDTIKDFDMRPYGQGGDVFDFSDLLQGEGRLGFKPGNLTNYLHFEFDAAAHKTVIYINTNGAFIGGYNPAVHASKVDQIIEVLDADLLESAMGGRFDSDYEIIESLISSGKLLTDVLPIQAPHQGNGGITTSVDITLQDMDGDQSHTQIEFEAKDLLPLDYQPSNQAPLVFGKNTSLLGLIGLDVLQILNLGAQDIAVYDVDHNLASVTLRFDQVLGLNVTNAAFNNLELEQLATELGLRVHESVQDGVLGLIAKSVSITITSIDSSRRELSNEVINQYLAAVKLGSRNGALEFVDGNLLSLDVLNAISIKAVDTQNVAITRSLGKLLDLSLITGGGLNKQSEFLEGTHAANTLDFSNKSEVLRLYGYDGNDVITGGSNSDFIYGGRGNDDIKGGLGHDIIYGGEGNDQLYGQEGNDYLNGDAGNDVLIGGAGDDQLYGGSGNNIFSGGAGSDVFISTLGARDTVIYDLLDQSDATGGHGADRWQNFMVADVMRNVDADIIDIKDLLTPHFNRSEFDHLLAKTPNDSTQALSYLQKYISVEQEANDTLLKVDLDGDKNGSSYSTLITLENTDTTLKTLFDNQQILF